MEIALYHTSSCENQENDWLAPCWKSLPRQGRGNQSSFGCKLQNLTWTNWIKMENLGVCVEGISRVVGKWENSLGKQAGNKMLSKIMQQQKIWPTFYHVIISFCHNCSVGVVSMMEPSPGTAIHRLHHIKQIVTVLCSWITSTRFKVPGKCISFAETTYHSLSGFRRQDSVWLQ